MTKDYVLTSSAENIFLLKNLQPKDHLLFLYTPDIHHINTLGLFLKAGVESNEKVLFISTGYTNKDIKKKVESILPDESCELFFGFNDPHRIIKQIRESKKQAKNKYNGLRMVIDYGHTPESCDTKDIIAIEKELSKTKNNSSPTSSISAFNTTCINDAILKNLVPFHEKVMISTENKFTALMYTNDGGEVTPVETVSKPALERVVKNHLDTLIMSMLMNNELCGYDIIKDIRDRFQIKLSPGTIYPILHFMKERGIIQNNGVSGRKTYIPTKAGEKVMQRKVQEFLTAKEYITEFIAGNTGK